MKLTWMILPALLIAGGCADDTGSDDGTTPASTGGPTDGGTADPTGDPSGDPTGDPTGDPDPGTTGGDPPGTSDDAADTTAGEDTASTEGDGTTGDAGTTVWALEVDVDLGGQFPVTADTTVIVAASSFEADVLTVMIAGAPEEHMIPLAGTLDGETLTMTDSMFDLDVGGVAEQVSVSGTATLTADALTGSGTFTTVIDGGEPFPGTWAITSSTLVE